MRQTPAVRVDGTPQRDGEFNYYYGDSGAGADRSLRQGIVYRCPCGCRALFRARFGYPHRGHPDGHPRWDWDGDVDRPSLTPSIHNMDTRSKRRWSGVLLDGVWESF